MTAAALVAGALLLAACGDSWRPNNAAIESVQVADGSDEQCGAEACVVVSGPVDGSDLEVGRCRLYGPGDPDVLSPLAESGDLRLEPGRPFAWVVPVTWTVPTEQLNPVCAPMMEG